MMERDGDDDDDDERNRDRCEHLTPSSIDKEMECRIFKEEGTTDGFHEPRHDPNPICQIKLRRISVQAYQD